MEYVVSYYVANQQHLLPLNGQKYDRTHFIKPFSRKRVYSTVRNLVVCTTHTGRGLLWSLSDARRGLRGEVYHEITEERDKIPPLSLASISE